MVIFTMRCKNKWMVYLLSSILYGVNTYALAEIVLPGSGNNNSISRSKDAASDARQKAKEAVSETPTTSLKELQNLISAQEEDGYMLPGRSSAPPDNRARAKEYIQNEAEKNKLIIITQPGSESSGDENFNKDNASKNVNKAKRYLQDQLDEPVNTGKFYQYGTATGVMGADGVIVMTCDGVNNNAGRIGDDTQSGSVFTINIKGKAFLARCK